MDTDEVPVDTSLTGAQQERLFFFEVDPSLKVVGWDIDFKGPVVKVPHGEEFTVQPNGETIPHRVHPKYKTK